MKPKRFFLKSCRLSFYYSLPALLVAGLISQVSAAPPTVDGSTSTTVTAAANGVPIVNISKQNADGVSRNSFSDFNVDTQGLILNNADNIGVSKLGGAILGNTNFAAGDGASIILNEVTSNQISNLNGYVETFGKQAEFILANPNGITCNGCGFINTSRATLITGSETNKTGAVGIFGLGAGNITFSGTGLNGVNLSFLEIISRAAVVQAEIRASNGLSIKTGNNEYNYASKVVTSNTTTGTGFAIDASLLGSMYSGQIELITTEAGVGVRSLGTVNALQDVNIVSSGNVDSAAISGMSITVKAAGTLTQNGNYTAKDLILLDANSLALTANIESDNAISLIARTGNISHAGSIKGGVGVTSLTAQAGDLTLVGAVFSAGSLSLTANTILNQNQLAARGGLTINTSADLNNETGKLIFSGADLVLNIDGTVNNAGDLYSRGNLSAQNQAGALMIAFNNNGGRVESGGDLTINAKTITNSHGFISNVAPTSTNQVDRPTILINKTPQYGMTPWDEQVNPLLKRGLIQSGGNMVLDTGSTGAIVNNLSDIYASGNLTVNTGTLNNTAYMLRSSIVTPPVYRKKCIAGRWRCRQKLVVAATLAITTTKNSIPSSIQSAGILNLTTAPGGEINNSVVIAGNIQNAGITGSVGDPLAGLSLPGEGGFFKPNPAPSKAQPYLIETDPALIDISKLFGSDYFLDRIGVGPTGDATLFLGDAFYDQRLIADQIRLLAGQRYLLNAKDDNEQYQQLADAAANERERLGLNLGEALSLDQQDQLQENILWYVETTIGDKTVLVPRLYLSKATRTLVAENKGALIQGKEVLLVTGNLMNEGAIISETALSINTEDQVINRGGTILAGAELSIRSKGTIISESILARAILGADINESVARVAKIKSAKKLTMLAEGDIEFIGSEVESGGDTEISAKGDLTLSALKLENTRNWRDSGGNWNYTNKKVEHATSKLKSDGNLILSSVGDMLIEGSDIETKGDAKLTSEGQIQMLAVKNTDVTTGTYYKKKTWSKTTGSSRTSETRYRNATLAAKKDISLSSIGDILIVGSDIETMGDAKLTSEGQIQMLAVKNTDVTTGTYYKKKTWSKTTGSSRTGETRYRNSTLAAKKDISLSSIGDTLILASHITADGDIKLHSETGNIAVIADVDINFQQRQMSKKGFSYTKKNDNGVQQEQLNAAKIDSGRHISFTTGDQKIQENFAQDTGNVIVAGSTISSGGNMVFGGTTLVNKESDTFTLSANDASRINNLTFDTIALNNKTWSFNEKKARGLGYVGKLFTGGEIININKNSDQSNTQAGTKVIATNNFVVNSQADINIKAAKIEVGGSAKFDALGDINIVSAINRNNLYNELVRANASGVSFNWDGSRASVGIDADYKKTLMEQAKYENQGSIVNVAGDLTLTGDDVTIAGSSLQTAGFLSIDAKQDLKVLSVKDILNRAESITEAEARLSVGVGNSYLDLVNTARAYRMAKRKVKQAKRALSAFDTEIKQMQVDLAKEFVTKYDIAQRKKERKMFVANLVMARVHQVNAAVAIARGVTAAVASTVTYGFYADARFEIKGNKTTKSLNKVANIASTLIADKDVTLTAGTDITILGSDIKAGNTLSLVAKNDIVIEAARNTSASNEKRRDVNMSIGYGTNGVSGNSSFNVGLAKSSSKLDVSQWRNSRLVSANTLELNSGNDTTLAGANASAKNVVVKTGGDFTIQSLQNTVTGRSKQAGISLASSSKENTSKNISSTSGSTNFGLRYGKGKQSRRWVDNMTTLTATDSVAIDSSGKTTVVGALIAQLDEQGVDGGKFTLKTAKLVTRDIIDHDTSSKWNAGLNVAFYRNKTSNKLAKKDNKIPPSKSTGKFSSAGVSLMNNGYVRGQRTLATLGKGSITDSNNNAIDVDNVNRDVDKLQVVTANRKTGGLNTSISTNDLKYLTVKGQKQVVKSFRDAYKSIGYLKKAAQAVSTKKQIKVKHFAKLVGYQANNRKTFGNAVYDKRTRDTYNRANSDAYAIRNASKKLLNQALRDNNLKDGVDVRIFSFQDQVNYNPEDFAKQYGFGEVVYRESTAGFDYNSIDLRKTDSKIEATSKAIYLAMLDRSDFGFNNSTNNYLANLLGTDAKSDWQFDNWVGGYQTDIGLSKLSKQDWIDYNTSMEIGPDITGNPKLHPRHAKALRERANQTIKFGNEWAETAFEKEIEEFNTRAPEKDPGMTIATTIVDGVVVNKEYINEPDEHKRKRLIREAKARAAAKKLKAANKIKLYRTRLANLKREYAGKSHDIRHHNYKNRLVKDWVKQQRDKVYAKYKVGEFQYRPKGRVYGSSISYRLDQADEEWAKIEGFYLNYYATYSYAINLNEQRARAIQLLSEVNTEEEFRRLMKGAGGHDEKKNAFLILGDTDLVYSQYNNYGDNLLGNKERLLRYLYAQSRSTRDFLNSTNDVNALLRRRAAAYKYRNLSLLKSADYLAMLPVFVANSEIKKSTTNSFADRWIPGWKMIFNGDKQRLISFLQTNVIEKASYFGLSFKFQFEKQKGDFVKAYIELGDGRLYAMFDGFFAAIPIKFSAVKKFVAGNKKKIAVTTGAVLYASSGNAWTAKLPGKGSKPTTKAKVKATTKGNSNSNGYDNTIDGLDNSLNNASKGASKSAKNNKGTRGAASTASFNFNTTPLKTKFKNEDTSTRVWGRLVRYLSTSERRAYQVFIKDGKVYNAKGKLYSTKRWFGRGNGRSIFVMDSSGRIYAHNVPKLGKFHHSSFLAGKPVAAAGEIIVEKGVITKITWRSGHYTPKKQYTDQFRTRLEKSKIDVSKIDIQNGF